MSKERSYVGFELGNLVFYVLFPILAYFTFGSIAAALGMLALTILLTMVNLLSFIPGVGFVIAALVAKFCTIPWALSLFGLSDNWLVSMLFWCNVGLGGFISVFMLIVLLAVLTD